MENSDEPYADRIAKAVIQVFRRGGTVDTTRQLYALIEGALSFLPAGERKEAVKKSCQRTFQALRIDVNSEFEVLYAFLDKLPHVLKPGGRAAILTFHSGEDRLVKQAFRQQYRDGLYSDIAQEVTRPSPQECRRNPRTHSTKLRWAVRAGVNADFMEKELTSMLRDETIRRVIQFRDDREWRRSTPPRTWPSPCPWRRRSCWRYSSGAARTWNAGTSWPHPGGAGGCAELLRPVGRCVRPGSG